MPTISFFMLVTNRDAYLASYAIASYAKLIPVLDVNYEWKLIVYANCLTNKLKEILFPIWKSYSYVEIYDNAQHCSPSDYIFGTVVEDGNGGTKKIEGPFEPCSIVWTREFAAFQSTYWATVDADMEILRPDFVIHALQRLEAEENLVVMSSERSDTEYVYCTYAQEYAYLMWRHHTWFCIYKNQAQQCKVSHFYYGYYKDSVLYAFDESARLQHSLAQKYGFTLGACTTDDPHLAHSFLHYGAFSKNISFNSPLKVAVYRLVCILNHYGILYISHKSIVNTPPAKAGGIG